MREDRETRYLGHIGDAIRRIEERTAGGRGEFLENDVPRDAVIRRLETLDDATGHLSTALRGRRPEIPWRAIADFRNRVAHGYLDVDLSLVWRVIEEKIPPLKAVIEHELAGPAHEVE